MLMEIRSYLQSRGSASLTDLSNHFRIAPDALRGMLAHWIGKGMVRQREEPAACGGCVSAGTCCGCAVSESPEIYDWIGRSTSALPSPT